MQVLIDHRLECVSHDRWEKEVSGDLRGLGKNKWVNEKWGNELWLEINYSWDFNERGFIEKNACTHAEVTL